MATGQLNQHKPNLSVSNVESQPLSSAGEQEKACNESARQRPKMKDKEYVELLEDPLPPVPIKEPITKSTETNFTFEHSTRSLVPSPYPFIGTYDLVGDSATDIPLATKKHSELKRGHSYEDIQTVQSLDTASQRDEPKYDDIITVSTTAAETSMNQPETSSLNEHRYDILCDLSIDIARELDEPESTARAEERHSSQCLQHYYEDVENVNRSQKKYDVLVSGVEVNPLQDSIIQEDANSPNEDQYYSTTRGHKLVPVGKPIRNDHMYEILEDTKTPPRGARRDSRDFLVRSSTMSSRSLERLDPMYDEPFTAAVSNRSNSLSKVNIYCDSLFDDPKYGEKNSREKRSTDRLFDDPSYWSRSEAKKVTERHVSFTVEPWGDNTEGRSSIRAAAFRKTK